jgi:hypothetical protein
VKRPGQNRPDVSGPSRDDDFHANINEHVY